MSNIYTNMYLDKVYEKYLFRKTIAEYIVENRCTLRAAAKQFGVSKSGVGHMVKSLKDTDPLLHNKVREVLDYNLIARSLRGGMAYRKVLKGKESSVYESSSYIAIYIIKNRCTLMQAADKFKLSQSTVFKRISSLETYNPGLYYKTKDVALENKRNGVKKMNSKKVINK